MSGPVFGSEEPAPPVVELDEKPYDSEPATVPETSAPENLFDNTDSHNTESASAVFVKKHWKKMLYALLMVIVVIIIIVFSAKEGFSQPFYLDQMSMKNTDPTFFKYTGRDRDVLGESSRDYYLQNRMYANNLSGPQLLEDNNAFANQTDYLDMPSQWRPDTAVSDITAAGVESSEQFVGGNYY